MNKRLAMDEKTAALYKQADLAYARMLVQEQRDEAVKCDDCGQPLTEQEYDEQTEEDPDTDVFLCNACAFIPDNGRCRYDP